LLAFASNVRAQDAESATADYAQVKHLIDEGTWNKMNNLQQHALVRVANADNLGMPVTQLCFIEGTDPLIVQAFHEAIEANPVMRYQHGGFNRWSTTATDGVIGATEGVPCTVTYSFVPDGTTIPLDQGYAPAPSNLFNRMNLLYGSAAVWQAHFHESFRLWGEINGINYVYEPNDDGATYFTSAGVLGVRGDIRIGMKNLDGLNGVLAYNYGPNNGDMTFDSGDAVAAGYGDIQFLENVTMHEHGHGMGLAHVCPIAATPFTASKLMEPFINLAYFSARHDDARSTQRRYGDDFENNDTQGTATALGTQLTMLKFEGDTIGALPTGFTQVSGADLTTPATGGENWQVGTTATSGSTDVSFVGLNSWNNTGRFVYINDDREAAQNGGEDLAILSPTFNTTGSTSLRMNFDYNHDMEFGDGWFGEVYARNGGAWTKVYSFWGDSIGWQAASVNMTPFIGAATQFAIRYNDFNAWSEGLAVDNIELARDGRGLKIDNVSADDDADVDWHTFTPASNSNLDVVLTPTGFTYQNNIQVGMCNTGANINSLNMNNLGFELRTAAATVVTVNAGGLGVAETLSAQPLTGGTQYFLRVFSSTATNDIQTYRMGLTLTPTSTPPTVVMTSGASDPTNTSPIPVTATFSESVSGFVAGDITPGNATVGGFAGGPSVYTFNLTPLGQGLVTANIAAGVATGTVSGLGNTAATQFSRTFDTVNPTVTITSGAADPTNTTPIPCTVTFNEPVTGFVLGDITPTNATTGGFAGGPTVFTFNLIPSGQGTVSAVISAGVCTDAATNPNAASNTLSRTFDSVQPTTVLATVAPNPTNTSPIPVTVTFSESVTGFVAGDITPTNGTVSNFAGTGANYSFDLNPSGQGTVSAIVNAGVAADSATNPNQASNNLSRTFDTVVPTVTIASATGNPTNANPIPCTVSFSESVTGFVAGDITPSNGSVANFAGTGANYTFDLVPGGQGLVGASIAAGLAFDGAGNGNTASNSFSRTFDSVGPTVSITSGAADPTNTTPIPCTVTFNEPVSGFVIGDITPTNATTGGFAGGPTVFTFNLIPSGQGTVLAVINAGVCTDAATNPNQASNTLSRVFDSVSPGVTIASAAPNPTNATPIACTVTFTESVTGFVSGDIAPTNATIGGFAGTGANYTFNLIPSGQGVVSAVITAGVATDSASNPNTVSNTYSNTFDTVSPGVTIASATSDPTNANPIACTVTFSESVTGFVSGDITPSNATITGFAGTGANYTFNLVPSGQGTVGAQIAANMAADSASNFNTASNSFSRLFDSVQPTVTLSSVIGDPTAAPSIPVTIQFSEPVTGMVVGDLVVAGTSNPSLAGFATVDGDTYTVNILPVNAGSITLDLPAGRADDSAANANTAAVQFTRNSTVPVELSAISLE